MLNDQDVESDVRLHGNKVLVEDGPLGTCVINTHDVWVICKSCAVGGIVTVRYQKNRIRITIADRVIDKGNITTDVGCRCEMNECGRACADASACHFELAGTQFKGSVGRTG